VISLDGLLRTIDSSPVFFGLEPKKSNYTVRRASIDFNNLQPTKHPVPPSIHSDKSNHKPLSIYQLNSKSPTPQLAHRSTKKDPLLSHISTTSCNLHAETNLSPAVRCERVDGIEGRIASFWVCGPPSKIYQPPIKSSKNQLVQMNQSPKKTSRGHLDPVSVLSCAVLPRPRLRYASSVNGGGGNDKISRYRVWAE